MNLALTSTQSKKEMSRFVSDEQPAMIHSRPCSSIDPQDLKLEGFCSVSLHHHHHHHLQDTILELPSDHHTKVRAFKIQTSVLAEMHKDIW